MMDRYVQVEEESGSSTLLFVDTNSGLENILLNIITEKLQNTLKLYALTDKKIPKSVSRLSSLSIHFLDQLAKDPSYVIIFLNDSSEKKKTYEIINKLAGKKSKILILLSYRMVGDFTDLILSCKDKSDASFLLIGDLFGLHMLKSPLSEIIKKAIAQKTIYLSGDDLIPIFPISEEDVVNGVEYALFGTREKNGFYALFYEHPQTLISLSHILKRLEPELSISFGKETVKLIQGKNADEANKFLKQKVGMIPLIPESSFLGFEKSALSFLNEKEIPYTPSRRRVRMQVSKKSSFSYANKIFTYVSFTFFIFIAVSFFTFFLSVFEFKNGVNSLTAGDIVTAKSNFNRSETLYFLVNHVVDFTFTIPSLFGFSDPSKYMTMYDLFMGEADSVIPITEKALVRDPTITKSELQSLVATAFNFYFLAQELSPTYAAKLAALQNLPFSSQYFSAMSVLPSVLGYDTPKSYLILLQNSNELRPTGGFIGSIAYVEFKDGRFSTPSIQDVYDLDGQLKGHVEPPFIVRRYLQPHLYLRDSNFSPEFSDTASSSALIYNLESGNKIDGVIAVDTQVLKTLIDIEGPVSIPGEKKTLTSQNIVDILQSSIEDNFFPGSTQKKQVLNSLLSQIMADFQSDQKKKLQFAQRLPELLSEKHILFSFAKPSLEKAFVASGLAGSLSDNRIIPNSVADFLSVNEANIGVNKVNEFVSRKVEYNALLKSAELDSDLLVTLDNKATEDYNVYLRVIVPKNSTLLKIFVNGADQKIIPAVTDPAVYEKKGFKAGVGLEVDQELRNQQKEIGINILVGGQSSKRIRFMYQQVFSSNIQEITGYSLQFVKQPGTEPYPLAVTLQSDGSFTVDRDDSAPVVYDNIVKSDKEFNVKILRSK